MAVSVFEMFKIGIGPSSSHTVGPMRAAHVFASKLDDAGRLGRTTRVNASLYGSLAHTGRGHGTDRAVMLGLQGEMPDRIDPDLIDGIVGGIMESGRLALAGKHEIAFDARKDLCFVVAEEVPTENAFAPGTVTARSCRSGAFTRSGAVSWSAKTRRPGTAYSRTKRACPTRSHPATNCLHDAGNRTSISPGSCWPTKRPGAPANRR